MLEDQNISAPEERYLRDRDVAARYGVGRQTVWRWAATTGDLPPPVKLGGSTRWRLSELEAWEKRAAVVPLRGAG